MHTSASNIGNLAKGWGMMFPNVILDVIILRLTLDEGPGSNFLGTNLD
jgi:hypothetical protein